MKTFFVWVGLLVISTMGYAQQDYLELLKREINTEKLALVTEAMQLSEEEGTIFWPIYNEYQVEVDKIQDKEFALLKDYAENYEKMTNEKASDILKRALAIDKEEIVVRQKYYKKMSAAMPAKRATQFFQIDNQIRLLIQMQISAEIPLIK